MSTLGVVFLVFAVLVVGGFLVWWFTSPYEDYEEASVFDDYDDDDEPISNTSYIPDDEAYVSPGVIAAAVAIPIIVNDKFAIDENGRAGSPMPLEEAPTAQEEPSDESTSGTEHEED